MSKICYLLHISWHKFSHLSEFLRSNSSWISLAVSRQSEKINTSLAKCEKINKSAMTRRHVAINRAISQPNLFLSTCHLSHFQVKLKNKLVSLWFTKNDKHNLNLDVQYKLVLWTKISKKNVYFTKKFGEKFEKKKKVCKFVLQQIIEIFLRTEYSFKKIDKNRNLIKDL